jgi:hypothetical protein
MRIHDRQRIDDNTIAGAKMPFEVDAPNMIGLAATREWLRPETMHVRPPARRYETVPPDSVSDRGA